jgi:hypothetical protein
MKIITGYIFICLIFGLYCLIVRPIDINLPIIPMCGMEIGLLISWLYGTVFILDVGNPEVHNDFDGFGAMIVATIFGSMFTLPIFLIGMIWIFMWS